LRAALALPSVVFDTNWRGSASVATNAVPPELALDGYCDAVPDRVAGSTTVAEEDPAFVRDGIVEKIAVNGIKKELVQFFKVVGEALGSEVPEKPVEF
jgi:hypothetical protein